MIPLAEAEGAGVTITGTINLYGRIRDSFLGLIVPEEVRIAAEFTPSASATETTEGEDNSLVLVPAQTVFELTGEETESLREYQGWTMRIEGTIVETPGDRLSKPVLRVESFTLPDPE